jgi:hypothetical protein
LHILEFICKRAAHLTAILTIIKRLFPTIFLLLLTTISLYAHTKRVKSKIAQVENGLFVGKGVVFADSIVSKYGIYDRMQFYKVPSVSIAVINKGKIEWAKAYGFADVGEQRKADVNTLYQAASISKSVNALCILKLGQEGRLSLDKDFREYLNTWRFPDSEFSKGKHMTLETC